MNDTHDRTIWFVDIDAEGQPTIWRHTSSTAPGWVPEEPVPVVRRCDIQDPDINWPWLTRGIQ